jgi:ABC-type phosphate/phosphonate transport system substrate-binding protein
MLSPFATRGCGRQTGILIALASGLALSAVPSSGQQAKLAMLHIGASGSMTGKKDKEKGAMLTLKAFIKDETGLDNEITTEKSWRDVVTGMAKGNLQIGVFQGYEFAWAAETDPKLKPLAIAVNIHRYPVVYIIVNKNDPAKDFAGLKGQSISIPAIGEGILQLFTERQCQAAGSDLQGFFSKVTTPENVEDALDDVVDGTTQATVVDQAALEAFKNRKPARFNKLKPAAKSQPFPPPVVAYYENQLDDATLQRFKQGLLGASQKETGQTLLTLFHLTNFEAVPSDFDQVLAATRKAYPPSPPK